MAADSALGRAVDDAAQASSPAEVEQKYRDVILGDHPNDAEAVKAKEEAIARLTDLKVAAKDAAGLRQLLADLRPLFGQFPKAKTAKIVRSLIDAIAKTPDSTQLQLEVCKEQVEWARAEKRTFLRQRIEARLAALLLETRKYGEALALISRLLTEVKRLDDKLLLVDIHLLEGRVHLALRNQPKAKAAITAARTAANAIYVPPALQADIDLQSGTLHAEERDYGTAFSYFLEAFEALSALDARGALPALKLMLLAKVMTADAAEVPAIVASKAGLKYAGPDVDAMKAVAKAYERRSLEDFQAALAAHPAELVADARVHAHLARLYDTLLEQNLARLIEPYSRVQIAHLAALIRLPADAVLAKLSQMILDKKFAGTLDQGAGCLEVFDESPADSLYPTTLDTFENMAKVVDTLFLRSQKLMA